MDVPQELKRRNRDRTIVRPHQITIGISEPLLLVSEPLFMAHGCIYVHESSPICDGGFGR